MQSALAPLLAVPFVDRTRRNHGLEHATLTLLARRNPGLAMLGRSTPQGFYLYGEAPTEAIVEAAHTALQRMQAGEHHLALHPNCGTNYVTAGIAAALAALIGFAGAGSARARLDRLPLVAVLTTLALMVGFPLGMLLQRDVTTSGQPGAMEIVSVERWVRGPVVTHFVTTQG